MAPLKRRGVINLEQVRQRAENGPFVAKIAGAVSGRQERKSARGNRFAFVQASDPTGLYEVTVFSDTLEAARAHLEPGTNVVMTVEATLESDQLKLLCRSAAPIDAAVSDPNGGSSGLRIFLEDTDAVQPLKGLLDKLANDPSQRARGPILVSLRAPGLPGEVDIALGERLPVSPQIKGAIKSLAGVSFVEDL
jgi:DNA polymerase-3 subunit alpha